MASMDKVRSALVQNAREETRVRQIICAPVVPHGEPRRLHLQPIPRELAQSPFPKKHGVFPPVHLVASFLRLHPAVKTWDVPSNLLLLDHYRPATMTLVRARRDAPPSCES